MWKPQEDQIFRTVYARALDINDTFQLDYEPMKAEIHSQLQQADFTSRTRRAIEHKLTVLKLSTRVLYDDHSHPANIALHKIMKEVYDACNDDSNPFPCKGPGFRVQVKRRYANIKTVEVQSVGAVMKRIGTAFHFDVQTITPLRAAAFQPGIISEIIYSPQIAVSALTDVAMKMEAFNPVAWANIYRWTLIRYPS